MQDLDEVVKLSVSSLRAHPQNDELNSPLKEYEKNALKSSIEESGITDPLWVLEDGTIVSGHQRWQIAKELGHSEVPCRIFRPEDDQDVLYTLVMANEARRGTETDPVKVAKKLRIRYQRFEIRQGKKNGHGVRSADIAAEFGISERTARRLLRILELIPELQMLVSEGKIGVKLANVLARMPRQQQLRIYDAMERTGDYALKGYELDTLKEAVAAVTPLPENQETVAGTLIEALPAEPDRVAVRHAFEHSRFKRLEEKIRRDFEQLLNSSEEGGYEAALQLLQELRECMEEGRHGE